MKVLEFLLLSAIVSCCYLVVSCCYARLNNIYLLTMLPYPQEDPDFQPSWLEGDNIRPALELAKDQINNSSSLLQNYTLHLVHADGGCEFVTTTAISFVREVFEQSVKKRMAGIIGPGCSFSTTALGKLTNRTELKLVHVHGAGDPKLADRARYPYMLGTLGLTDNFVKGFLYLMNSADWKNVGVFYDNSQIDHVRTTTLLMEYFNASLVQSVSNTFIPLSEIQQHRLRVTVVLCPLVLTRQILCLAYHSDMIYESYQWVIMVQLLKELLQPVKFVYDGEHYNCSIESMAVVLQYALLLNYKFTPTYNANLVSNTTYEQFLVYYKQYREAYIQHAASSFQ